MKFLFAFFFLLVLSFSQAKAQTGTLIQPTTTIQAVSKLKAPGLYNFIVPPDTTDFSIDSVMQFTAADSAAIIKKYVATHPCPVCPPPVVCPPPIVCPVCPTLPPPPKQRTVVKRTTVHTANVDVDTYLYDDGSTSTL